ncbi:type II secretion system protein N [Thauera aromatica]|uniref:type II secretion system protein N n=1 Tax=Thauera aromatica TaxID=59405 RepID=UPI001FFC3F10|nr:type II secretion system protein N [Thauera aromatica]MCK2094552.1 hypothetical protein [Thauera aromatica]
MNAISATFHTIDWSTAGLRLAQLALVAGIGIWGALVLAPPPAALPPALAPASTQGVDTTPVARWFGGGTSRLRVTVAGLMAGGNHGAALLAINGSPAQAYRVGETLAPGVSLAGVQADAVLIDQDGVVERLAVPAGPATAVPGLIPVSAADE